MTEKRIQQLIAKALCASEIDQAKYYHMCWWEGRLRCLHVHHTKEIHPVFFAAPGEVFMGTLNPRQWQLLTERILEFCRKHNITASGRSPRDKRHTCTGSSWSRPKITRFDAKRLRMLQVSDTSPGPSTKVYLDKLHRLLKTADTVAPQKIPHDVVTMNSRVRLKDDHENKEMSVSLVFPANAATDPGPDMTKVSVLTPLGLAILGRRVGDRAEGRVAIHDLLYQPEAAGHFDL